MGHHERRWLLKTAGRWPWKSESAKECVTTHLPKQLALKMDGAEASSLYSAVSGKWGGNGGARERVESSWPDVANGANSLASSRSPDE